MQPCVNRVYRLSDNNRRPNGSRALSITIPNICAKSVMAFGYRKSTSHHDLAFDLDAHATGSASNHLFDGVNVFGVHIVGFFFGDLGQLGIGQLLG